MIDITRRTRAKRVVVVQLEGKEPETFRTCPEVYLKYNSKQLGICLNALWNALAKDGKYKNRHCSVKYQNIDQLKTLIWD